MANELTSCNTIDLNHYKPCAYTTPLDGVLHVLRLEVVGIGDGMKVVGRGGGIKSSQIHNWLFAGPCQLVNKNYIYLWNKMDASTE